MPPLRGVFLDNSAYFYSGEGGGETQFKLGGDTVVGLKADVPGGFPDACSGCRPPISWAVPCVTALLAAEAAAQVPPCMWTW